MTKIRLEIKVEPSTSSRWRGSYRTLDRESGNQIIMWNAGIGKSTTGEALAETMSRAAYHLKILKENQDVQGDLSDVELSITLP